MTAKFLVRRCNTCCLALVGRGGKAGDILGACVASPREHADPDCIVIPF